MGFHGSVSLNLLTLFIHLFKFRNYFIHAARILQAVEGNFQFSILAVYLQ